MNLLEKRNEIGEEILKKRFTKRVLGEVANDMAKAQEKIMGERGFEANDWYSGRAFQVSEDSLGYQHLKKHRFVDMKTRKTKEGTKPKKSHPVHNRIIWGHYNNLIKELHFGFTEAVKHELGNLNQ